MTENNRQLRVFLCHSSSDKEVVRNLYHQLRSEGIDPWFDEESLLAGQDWQLEITKAVRNSDVVLVCLSQNSINKSGFVQKEIKYALDISDEQPEGTIFLIPIKLEYCDVPERLSRPHWVNFFEEKGFERLMKALKVRAEDLGISISSNSPKFEIQSIETNSIDNPEVLDDYGIIIDNFPNHRSFHLRPSMDEWVENTRINYKTDFEIVVTQEVLLKISEHVSSNIYREVGGFLLGNRYKCPNTDVKYIIIDQYLESDFTEEVQISLSFTSDSWSALIDDLDGKFRGKNLLGWYHSHPGMGVFLSNSDVDIQRNRFESSFMTALVIDPKNQLGGFFMWRDGEINSRIPSDFYELFGYLNKETVVAWTNYTAYDDYNKLKPMLSSNNTKSVQKNNNQTKENTPNSENFWDKIKRWNK